jgi:integrase
MAREWTGKWEGGRTRLGRNGETVWVIERMHQWKPYTISLEGQGEPMGTDPQTGELIPPASVRAELALFWKNPAAYKEAREPVKPGDVIGDGTVAVTAEALDQYAVDAAQGDPKWRISEKQVNDNLRYLRAWMRALKGQDLRKLTLRDYRAHLRSMEPKRQHVVALRAFTHWLRREGRLASAQDASRDLEIPRQTPRRSQRTLGYSMEDFAKLYASITSRPFGQMGVVHHSPEVRVEAVAMQTAGASVKAILEKYGISEATYFTWKKKVRAPKPTKYTDAQSVRDVLVLRALCGLHHSEVERIAKGDFKVKRLGEHGEIAGTLLVWHKSQVFHPQALCAQALAAAERLQAKGSAPADSYVRKLMDEAADRVGLPRMLPGELRHSFVTWARTYGRLVRPKDAGVSLEAIARVVGHTTTKTTSTFYDNTEVPELIVLPLKLENVEDPAELDTVRRAG